MPRRRLAKTSVATTPMIPENYGWKDKFVTMREDNPGKAKVMSDGIFQKIQNKMK